jgi:ABC-type transport system involved in multi-copper enzyme maturation permease subunit
MTEAAPNAAAPMAGPRVTPWASVIEAELRKLASRASARVSLLLLTLGAVVVPVGLLLLRLGMSRAASSDSDLDPSAWIHMQTAVHGVLVARNFFVARAFIIWVVAEAVAGELVARTLREDLLRPVSRAAVVAAKWVAIQVFVLSLALWPLVLSAAMGLVLFGPSGEPLTEVRGYALSWVGDVGFATMVLFIALLLRSVPGTVMGVFLYWVLDQALGILLWAVEKGRGFIESALQMRNMEDLMWIVDAIIHSRPWLPSAAFNLYWNDDPATGLLWQSWVALGLITAASFGLAVWRLRQIDID